MDEQINGYIPISRKIFNHKFWLEKREFSKAEAWIDLLQLASYEDKEKEVLINNKVIKYGRGQVVASIRFLQKRWLWASTKRVFTFLNLLENGNMIRTEKETGQNIITICKYESYNPKKSEGKQQGNSKETARKQQGNESNKEIKKEYKECVFLLESEYQKLIAEHGHDKTDWMLDKLNNSKLANGKKYKSDYRAILNWVVEAAATGFKPKPKNEISEPTKRTYNAQEVESLFLK